jgi:hypothetical protein
MSGRIRGHLRSNIIAYCALFFALTGVAAALPGTNTVFSDDIVDGAVQTQDIANGGVATADLAGLSVNAAKLAPNGVNSGKVLDNGIKAPDIGPDAVGTSEVADNSLTGTDVLDESLGSADVTNGSVTGTDIQDNSVSGADISDGYSTAASDTGGGCNDDDSNGETCATLNITLSETAKLLVTATGGWHTHGTSGIMSCRLDHDGIETIGTPQSIGEVGADHPLGGGDGTMALTGLSADIGPGTHAISLICTQTDADLDLTNSNLTVATVDE